MNNLQNAFFFAAKLSASQAGHPFPEYAAAEAALESNWGRSALASTAFNLFGTKQHKHPIYGTLALPTHEYEHGQFVAETAEWVKYPDWAACFTDRLATLKRLSMARDLHTGALEFPHYAAALAATDGETFVREVSQTWSTDPHRADKVLEIFKSVGSPT